MSESSVFERFKQTRPFSSRQKTIPQVLFQLVFRNKSARLLTVDKDLKPIKADFRNYLGATRNVLKALSALETESQRSIKWDQKETGIDLGLNSFLLWQLKRCDSFIDETGKSIQFSEAEGSFFLSVKGEEQLECRIGLHTATGRLENIEIISELHAYHNGIVYPVSHNGTDYTTLLSFETLILPTELEKYLSLYFSYCPEVELRYKDYRVVEGLPIQTKPTVVIDKLTPDHSLFLKTVRSLPGYDPEFLDLYDITKVALIDSDAQQIITREIDTTWNESPANHIRKLLNQQKNESEQQLEFYQDESFFIIEYPLSEIFVRNLLPALLKDYEIFGSEKLQTYNLVVGKPELSLSLDHGVDFLEGSVELIVSGERFSLFEALHQFRNQSYIQLNDGTRSVLDHGYVQKLERIFEKSKEDVKVSFFDLPILEELLEARVEGEGLTQIRKVFDGFLELKNQKVEPPTVNVELRPYQKDGYKWLRYLHDNALGACLADDMGLGKTLQAIALLSDIYPGETLPSLIIMPKSLIFNWQSEVARFNPNLSVTIYHGPERNLEAALECHLVLTTYGTVRADIELLKDCLFYYVILDESQYIKNHESQVSRAVSVIQAKHRLALSGTPIENNLGELYSLFRFLNPAMFGNLAKFNRQYLFPIQQLGNREVAAELKKKIYPFILRRLKRDVLEDLPDKIEKTIIIEMNENQRRFYEQRRTFYYDAIRDRIETEGFRKSQFFVLQAITALRQIASIPEVKTEGQILSPKRELLQEFLKEAIANEHKVLVFANFLGVLEYVAQDLKHLGIDFETLTGSTRNRDIPVNRFQSDPNCKVFLMTLKAGGQGLNLTSADTVFIFDPWWNLAAENQAIDRSHRIGQNKTVFSNKLIVKDSIEERMLSLQRKKQAVFETIISDESMSYQDLGEDDIDYLMR